MNRNIEFYGWIVLAAVVAILFETDTIISGLWGGDGSLEFVVLTAMELLVVALVPVTLKYFRQKRVQTAMIGLPMTVNTLLYYMFLNATFGYIALLLLVCMPFVKPKKETGEE